MSGGVSWIAGKHGTGLSFDGTSGFVSVGDAPSLDLGNKGTISAWVKLDTLDKWHGVIAKGAANKNALHNYALEINNSNRFMCIVGNGENATTAVSSFSAVTGLFYHAACVWDGSTLQLYVDGAAAGSVTQTFSAASNSAPLYIGQFGGNTDRLDGVVDEVRIYGTALGQAQIVEDMNTPIQGPPPDSVNPAVNITAPTAGAVLSGTVTVMANASDDTGVAGVQFQLDGQNLGAEDGAAPYSIAWNTSTVSNGTHVLSAVARDAAGNRGSAANVSVDVRNDTTPPTIPAGLTAIAASSTQINLAWNASSDDVGVAGYRITRNGSAIATTNTPSYQDKGLSPGSSYTYTVAAFDQAGRFSAESSPVTAATPGLPPPAAPGPVASYALNENAGSSAADGSENGNDGTLMNSPTWTAARFGTGLSFDGTNEHVIVADSDSLDLGSTGTIEAWVKLDSLNRWNSVIAKGSANLNAGHNYALEITNGNQFMCILGNGATPNTLRSPSTASTGVFYHLACVWNGTTLQLYVDGTLVASTAQSITPVENTAPLYIGLFGGDKDPIDGVIDEVRIYNRALTQAEIESDMNSPL
ncbi:MAG: Ig-like domain-containing protein [Acidobacteriales bacterium]|nr:Ig-like domain-containing protein [Terriglobales bacterium]